MSLFVGWPEGLDLLLGNKEEEELDQEEEKEEREESGPGV